MWQILLIAAALINLVLGLWLARELRKSLIIPPSPFVTICIGVVAVFGVVGLIGVLLFLIAEDIPGHRALAELREELDSGQRKWEGQDSADLTGDSPCLRRWDSGMATTAIEEGWWCVNKHTGCIYNDGHNTCSHEGRDRCPLEDA